MKTSKLLNFLINIHPGIFIGIFFLLGILIDLPFLGVPEEASKNESWEQIKQTGGKLAVLFAGVIIAPLIETFVFQFSVIKILRFLIKNAALCFYIALLVSALLFSINHWYSVYYLMNTFFMGLLYAFAFYIGQYRRDMPAFLLVASIHGLGNLFAFVMDELVF